MKITITEALAEIPTIKKRVEKKKQFIQGYLFRQSIVKDVLEKDGGSAELIKRELQAISDLYARFISIRAAIQKANSANILKIGDVSRTVTDWLTWKREIANDTKEMYSSLRQVILTMRNEIMKKGMKEVEKDTGNPTDIVVNIDEKYLSENIESIETVLGELDGKLSLHNAKVEIDI